MILTQTNGIKLIFTIFLFSVINCKSKNNTFAERNFFNKDYFYNDSLKVGIDFWGGLEFHDTIYNVRKLLKKDKNGFKFIKKSHLLLSGFSKVNKYRFSIFYENCNDNLKTTKNIYSDTINKIAIFTKQKGFKKIIVYFKSNTLNNKYSTNLTESLMRKVQIDSVDNFKLSYFSIYDNYDANPLQAINKIKKAPINDKNMKFQMLTTANSFISDNSQYDSLISSSEIEKKQKYNQLFDSIKNSSEISRNVGVYEYLNDVVKNHQIIILNENHYYPKHRLFATKLLQILKRNGFSYLSLEGFYESNKTDYIPNMDNGTYVKEPYFSHFIRKAKLEGYNISGHESQENGAEREIGQAKNVMKILDKNPSAKIFIYVGISHLEKKVVAKKRWMASYLQDFSGIEPLTINQTKISFDSNDELTLIPSKYFSASNIGNSSADYFLNNNLNTGLNEIYPNNEFKNFIIVDKIFNEIKNIDLLISVFNQAEYINLKNLSVPIVNWIKRPINNQISLNLPTGKYKIIMKSNDNKIMYNDDIIVK